MDASLERSSTHLAHVNAGHLVSLSMPVAELSHSGNRVQACVFGQSWRDYFKCVTVCPYAVGLHTTQCAWVLSQTHSKLNFWSATASNQSPDGWNIRQRKTEEKLNKYKCRWPEGEAAELNKASIFWFIMCILCVSAPRPGCPDSRDWMSGEHSDVTLPLFVTLLQDESVQERLCQRSKSTKRISCERLFLSR